MTAKNYGAAVSGYLDPDGRAWETAVYQAGKPVLDKELNLAQDIDGGAGQLALRRAMPSGWLSPDFLDSADAVSGVFLSATAPNIVNLPATMLAHVNGWLVQVTNTGVASGNQVTLPSAPASAGTQRTDVVVLEVWRRLISATPSTVGKSPTGRIWRNGNVKIPSGSDAGLNFADDIEDTNVAAETTKRVQIQYRLRVMSADVFAYPYVLDDPSIVANSVPASAGAPDGVPTTFAYTNQAANGDPGLWRAGDGNPANTIGSVDGYIYALPVSGYFRRNQSAFDRNANQNGAGAFGGSSGRPDGLFYDLINAADVADFRTGVNPSGWDFAEVLQKSFQSLLDNTLQTDWVTTPYGGGVSGHTVLWNDEIGVSTANGGDGVVTGDTPGGPLVGQFDAGRRIFSDRPILEVVTVKIPAPGGAWGPSSTVSIDPTALPVYPYSAFNWAAYNPASVLFADIVGARWTGSGGTKKNINAMPYVKQVANLGAAPVVSLTMTFISAISGLSLTDEPIFIDILVAYPAGSGLTYTPTNDFGSASISVNNPGQLPAGAPISYASLAPSNALDYPHREVQLQYRTSTLTYNFNADSQTSLATFFVLPERASSIVAVSRNSSPIVGSVTLDATGRIATFTNSADRTSPGDTLSVQYVALRPLPQNGEQVSLWYWTKAPQTARSALLGTSLTMIPRRVADKMFALTVGSGSIDEAYPYPYQYVQTGGIYPTSSGTFSGEHQLNGRGTVAVATFSAETGFLQLPVQLPYVPDTATFNRSSGDKDIEGRTFFKSVPGATYVPNAYAQDLSDPMRHKVVLPVLMELPATSPLGWPGQLVLMLLVRYAPFDERNNVVFNPDLTQNTTVASVFRVKGNLLSKR